MSTQHVDTLERSETRTVHDRVHAALTRTALVHTGLVVAASLLYNVVLFLVYRDAVSPEYSYQGLSYRTPAAGWYALITVCTTVVAIVLPRRLRLPSDFMMWLMFLLAVAPGVLLAQYMRMVPVPEATRFGLTVCACMLLLRLGLLWRPLARLRFRFTIRPSLVWLALAAFAVLTYLTLILVAHAPLTWVHFGQVYVVRARYVANEGSVPALGYALPIVHNVINPAFMARGIYARRRRLWLLAGVLGQVLIYNVTGQKVVLISLVAVVGVVLLFSFGRRVRGDLMFTAYTALAVVSVLADKVLGSVSFTEIVVRRFMVFPGAIAVAYVAVFRDLPKADFAGTPFFWMPAPYGRGPSFMVGEFLTGNPLNNAGVNLFGHGYFEFGYAGMFAESAVLLAFLWALDVVARGLPLAVVSVVVLMPAIALSGANVFTSLSTHGLFASLLILAILPRVGWDIATEKRPSPLGRARAAWAAVARRAGRAGRREAGSGLPPTA